MRTPYYPQSGSLLFENTGLCGELSEALCSLVTCEVAATAVMVLSKYFQLYVFLPQS